MKEQGKQRVKDCVPLSSSILRKQSTGNSDVISYFLSDLFDLLLSLFIFDK